MSFWGGGHMQGGRGGGYPGGGYMPLPQQDYYNNPYNPQVPQVTNRPRQQVVQRTASAPAPAERNTLWGYFQKVDRNQNGQIDSNELQNALSNGTWTPFNPETIRVMISMFDRDNKGTINFHEFESLWKYITDWQATFQRFDTDGSGNIDRRELKRALTSFGYKLSDGFYDQLIRRFDRTRSGLLNFDDFIQLCVILQTLTATFKEKDKDRKGVVRISFEEFLSMVLRSKI